MYKENDVKKTRNVQSAINLLEDWLSVSQKRFQIHAYCYHTIKFGIFASKYKVFCLEFHGCLLWAQCNL